MLNMWNSLPNWVVSANTTDRFDLKLDWINSGTIKILYITSEPSCMEKS